MATEIWNENYQQMIGQAQIDYMLDKMYSQKKLQTEFDENYIWEFITLREEAIGYLSCRIDEQRLFLSKLYIQSQFQGKGYARESLQHVMDLAFKTNCNQVYLTVNKNNTKGIRAYERFGFKKIDEKVMDIGGGYVMDDYVYEIHLD